MRTVWYFLWVGADRIACRIMYLEYFLLGRYLIQMQQKEKSSIQTHLGTNQTFLLAFR